MFKRTLSAWSLGGSCLDSPRLVLYSRSVSGRIMGLPLTIATTSGPCSFVHPDTPARAIRPSNARTAPICLAGYKEAGRSLPPFTAHRSFPTTASCKSILLGSLIARLISGRGFCHWGCGRCRARHGRLFTLGLQCAIDSLPDLIDRLSAGDPFAVDEERGGPIDIQMIGLLHRREHCAVVLLLQADIELCGVDLLFR